ncbi:MAG: ERF family protein [Planctomycetota bacterium]
METSEQISEIAAALAAFQVDVPPIPRNRTVTVKSKKTGGQYQFAYATLDAIQAAIRPAMKEHGLSIVHAPHKAESGLRLETRLMHSSGQWISCDLPVHAAQADGAQALGSALTYMRRYSLTALLGISADEDDDGNAADGNALLSREDWKAKSPGPPPNPSARPTQTPVGGEQPAASRDEQWRSYLAAREDAPALMAALDQCLGKPAVAGDRELFAGVVLAFGDEIKRRAESGSLDETSIETLTAFASAKAAQQPPAKQ